MTKGGRIRATRPAAARPCLGTHAETSDSTGSKGEWVGRLDDIARFTVTRLRGKAEDYDPVLHPGETTFLASGFWMQLHEGHRVFCTNKHNVEPSMKRAGLRLAQLEIEVRKADGNAPAFYRVQNLDTALWMHETADCAVIVDPEFENLPSDPKFFPLPETWLATQAHFERLQLADEAFFIGFPGFEGHMWFDEAAILPIGRSAALASIPSIPFTNAEIRTSDTLMVAGLSFTGSSGSLVVNRAKGIPPGGDIHDPSHVPAYVIGIMSGHFSEPAPPQPAALRHGGLSYLTRSTALHELFQAARNRNFVQ